MASLLCLGAIEPVPVENREKGLYSKCFRIPRKNEGWRLILDLRSLTRYVKTAKIQDGDPYSNNFLVRIRRLVHDFFPSRCIFSYFYSPFTQEVSSFSNQQEVLPLLGAPFGLSLAPRISSKVLVVVDAHLCLMGIICFSVSG